MEMQGSGRNETGLEPRRTKLGYDSSHWNARHRMITPSPTSSLESSPDTPKRHFEPKDIDAHPPEASFITARTDRQSPEEKDILRPTLEVPKFPSPLSSKASPCLLSLASSHTPIQSSALSPTSFIPTRTIFPAHPTSFERLNTWWAHSFSVLFNSIQEFAQVYFGSHDLSLEAGLSFQPWDLSFPDGFIAWVEMVAECDVEDGGWDALLRDSRQRVQLVAAVVGRVLFHECIWEKELFGAEEDQVDLLKRSEVVFVDGEGFDRTHLRSQLVRGILGSNPITNNFHPEVNILATQIALLFRPLTDFLYSLPVVNAVHPLPSILAYHQQLHDIVSHAGYLSICARSSSSIFIFNHKMPGDRYDEDHDDMDGIAETCMEESKAKKTRLWQAGRHDCLEELARTQSRLQKLRKEHVRAGSSSGPLEADIASKQAEVDLLQGHRARLNSFEALYSEKVKIAVWPMIDRYLPGSGEAGGEQVGMRIWRVMDATVVGYWMEDVVTTRRDMSGCTGEERGENLGLDQWLREGRRLRGGGWMIVVVNVGWAVLILVALWLTLRYIVDVSVRIAQLQ